jgi:hypothetical protein
LVEPHASFTLTSRHRHVNQVVALGPNAFDVRSLSALGQNSRTVAAEPDGELRATATVVRLEDAAARVQRVRTQIKVPE